MRSHRANKAHKAEVDGAMAAAGFELAPDLDRAREQGRQVWMRRVSPGCVVMIARRDGLTYGDPREPYWSAIGLDGTGHRLNVRDVTLAAAVMLATEMETGELTRLGWKARDPNGRRH
jgi:hypothetical protein